MGSHHAKVLPEEKANNETDKIVFLYDFKSASKHFLCGTYMFLSADDEEKIKRYDDFDVIQHRRGVEIRKIGFYKKDGKIIGYEIEYHDSKKKKIVFKRLAKKYENLKLIHLDKIKLNYNEHIADIEVVYGYNDIKYIEIVTSKGQILKSGNQPEDCYTSISKIDVSNRLFTPIIAFASTFTPDCLKEILIYRCPVRISKRKMKKEYTVGEINNMKIQQPNSELEKKDLIKNITKKSVAQFKVLKAFDNMLIKARNAPEIQANQIKSPIPEKQEEKVDALEKYDVGIESDDDEDEEEAKKKEEKPKTAKEKLVKSLSGRFSIFRTNTSKIQADDPKKKSNFFKEIFSPAKLGIGRKSPKEGESPGLKRDHPLTEIQTPDGERRNSLFSLKKDSGSPGRKGSASIYERFFKTSVNFGGGNKDSEDGDDKKSELSSPGSSKPLIIPMIPQTDENESSSQDDPTQRKKNKLLALTKSLTKKD